MDKPKHDLQTLRARLRALADPEKAAHARHFFKTAPGEYGEGDRFLGIRMPEIGKLARTFRDLDRSSLLRLLHSPLHGERLLSC